MPLGHELSPSPCKAVPVLRQSWITSPRVTGTEVATDELREQFESFDPEDKGWIWKEVCPAHSGGRGGGGGALERRDAAWRRALLSCLTSVREGALRPFRPPTSR